MGVFLLLWENDVQQNPRPRGLGLIADFLDSSGTARVKLMKKHIDWVDIPGSGAHVGYGPAESAILNAFAAAVRGPGAPSGPAPRLVLDRMVNRAPDNMRRAYEELGVGTMRLMSRRMTPVSVNEPMAQFGRLQVRMNHIAGLVDPKGNKVAGLLYFKEPELTTDAVAIVTRLMEREMHHVLPGATPVVVDLRRGKVMKRSSQRRLDDLDTAIRCEVRAYVELWDELRASMLPS